MKAFASSQAQIMAEANRFALQPTSQVAKELGRFGELLLEWNARINLGGPRLEEELVVRHFVDAFAASTRIPAGAHVADVGSGGGLPAIPLALTRPDLSLELFEPVGKKVAFLRTAVRELALASRVKVHPQRVDVSVPSPLRGQFDVAMSRATWAPDRWLPVGRALVRAGGQVLVFATGLEDPPLPTPHGQLVYAADRQLLSFS